MMDKAKEWFNNMHTNNKRTTMERLTKEHIENMIMYQEVFKYGKKTTACLTVLTNGFEIITNSACVAPADYNEAIGEDLCKKRAVDKIWELEGYRCQVEDHRDRVGAECPSAPEEHTS